jgi:hypothetical protein
MNVDDDDNVIRVDREGGGDEFIKKYFPLFYPPLHVAVGRAIFAQQISSRPCKSKIYLTNGRCESPERFPEIIDFACRDGDKKFLIFFRFVSGHLAKSLWRVLSFGIVLYDQQHHGLVFGLT